MENRDVAFRSPEELTAGLARQGWEIKAGQWHAPGYDGRLVPLWSAETLDGPLPSELDAARQYRIVRASTQPLYAKAFTSWLSIALQRKSGGIAFSLLPAGEQKALAEGSDTGGGFAVPAELAARIISVVRERSLVRESAIILPTSRDNLSVPVFDFTAEWVNEVMASTDTSLPVASLGIRVHKIRAKVGASDDLIADQPALLSWLTRVGGDQIALAEDHAFIGGSGIGQPYGLVNQLAGSNNADITGATAHTVSAGSASKIITLESTLPDAYRRRSRWLVNATVLGEIRGLEDANGRPLFPSFPHPLTGDDCLMSHPISSSSAMPADGTAGARCLVLVDLSQVVIATRNLLTVRVDTETYGDQDKTLIYIYDRVGGQLAVTDAARIGTVT